ncbi:MAG: hypothetical protein WB565_05365 [Acidimicrobiales bacterium]
MELKAGTRLKSAVSEAEVVVIKAAPGDVDLRCGGVAMLDGSDEAATSQGGSTPVGSVELGKRYVDDDTLEVLCSKGGAGELSVGDRPLVLKSAKPLPSSD